VVGYIGALVASIAIFVLGLVFMKYLVKYRKFSDVDFPFLIFVLYFIELVLLIVDLGFENLSFLNALPTGNVGPLMFFTLPFAFLLPKKARKYYHTIVALLSPVMLIFGVFCSISFIVMAKAFYATNLLDILCHAIFSVYGIYLVRSKQVDFEVKRNLVAGGCLLGVPLLMLILNAIFQTAFFGLSVYGDHNIYNIIFPKSAAVSIVLYFVMLAVALVAGYFYQKAMDIAHDALFGDAPTDSSDSIAPTE